MAEEKRSLRLRSGGYLGDISALCLLHVPGNISSHPFLLAGTGSQILLYDVGTQNMVNLFNAFEGVRVHGIFSSAPSYCKESSKYFFRIAVYGEKSVKLFHLAFDERECLNDAIAELVLIHSLPRFGHWVMDVCLLKVDGIGTCYDEEVSYLAVGLSDNSICLWDLCEAKLALEVQSPEKCLLYSMRFWGDNLKYLRVASGTIYNEILVWTIAARRQITTISVGDYDNPNSMHCKYFKIQDLEYEAVHLSRLVGHEGSIFRFAWTSDGSKLMSVSDDRSARIWTLHVDNSGYLQVQSTYISAGLVLFGHGARIWDCDMSDSLIITASEDCTCRIWGTNGDHYLTLKEHTGRGIWRCLYDQTCSIIITAGFDSVIKVHPLVASLTHPIKQTSIGRTMSNRTEIFEIFVPNASYEGGVGGLNSKSEYVRCLHFAREDTLYVATNHGYLYHVNISIAGTVNWTEVVQIFGGTIICMNVLSKSANLLEHVEDWIAVGDANGNATVVKIIFMSSCPKVAFSCYWMAERERQLLGIYWCKSLTCSHIFTADPGGRLKLWRISDFLPSFPDKTIVYCEAYLAAEFLSDFGARVVCLDVSFEHELLVCGDQRGNVTAFNMGKSILVSTLAESRNKILPCSHFKAAHGISSVTSVFISKSNCGQVCIHSTGKDGCICYFLYDKQRAMLKGLNFLGLKKVKEICAIESFHNAGHLLKDLGPGTYAIGFTSSDFIIWDLANEFKILQVPCGGWRRPHSYFLGDTPEVQNCFGYVKDHIIHVHKVWVPTSEARLLPQVLHLQFHGREIHSICFISVGLEFMSCQISNQLRDMCWVATGSEDGTVRLTRYAAGEVGIWSSSKLLGEHVGGSAVKSICFVGKTHAFMDNGNCKSLGKHGGDAYSRATRDPLLLISAGARQVLTCWLLQCQTAAERYEEVGDIAAEKNLCPFNASVDQCVSISFHWLSNHMPSKFSSTRKRSENKEEALENVENIFIDDSPTRIFVAENGESSSKTSLHGDTENDWRYLSVTAFLVRSDDSQLLVCFVVVACSDATLTLRALVLPCRLWFDVAFLVPQASPVLALQHVVIPTNMKDQYEVQTGSFYLVVSGSTDGSISFWDLTETIRSFMLWVSEIQPEKLLDCNRRPRTGRGSQGGRWWRSLTNESKKKYHAEIKACGNGGSDYKEADSQKCNIYHDAQGKHLVDRIPSNKIHEVQPLYVMHSIHQSGINCLHVSHGKGNIYHVISGGDDQALHCVAFQLELRQLNDECVIKREQTNISALLLDRMWFPVSDEKGLNFLHKQNKCGLRFLYHDTVASAHNSAVKGVWTDGTWVFSTGLDQRVRSWHLGESGRVVEYAHLIVDVPEPESLAAKASERNSYQIVIGGRGMQMVEFVVPVIT